MEHYGSSGQLAVTNVETAVIVASFYENVTALPSSAIELQLDNGQNGTVSDVQAFPGQANVFLIEVRVQLEGCLPARLDAVAGVADLHWLSWCCNICRYNTPQAMKERLLLACRMTQLSSHCLTMWSTDH